MTDADEIAAFVDAAGAADLVTFDGVKPVASLIPVIWDRMTGPASSPPRSTEAPGAPAGRGGQGRLIGHLAAANPQWQTLAPGARALAIVHGSQAYISPSWYPSTKRHGRAVPTWNYTTVHFTGALTVHRDEHWLRDVVGRLTGRHERGRAAPWAVADAPDDYINGMLRAIVGVEMAIESVEAKSKLSQNRSAEDRAGAVAGLRADGSPGALAIADLMAGLPGG